MDFFTIFFIVAGAAIGGGILTWLVLRVRMQEAKQRYAEQLIQEKYVPKESFLTLQEQADVTRAELHEVTHELRTLEIELTEKNVTLQLKEEQLLHQQEESRRLREQSLKEFQNIASTLLAEKSRQFTLTNKQEMEQILRPLKERISDFKQELEQKLKNQTETHLSLREEMKQLRSLNQQLSTDANNLAQALKGDSKLQGNWGEIQLERILENTGLKKEIHFTAQFTGTGEESKVQRPDFVVHLPEEKHLIIDSKVSLKDFSRYYHEEDASLRKQYLKAHIQSLRRHIKELSKKEYHHIASLNSPDYVLMFVPVEAAFTAAIREEPDLLTEALEQNVVLVTTSTLLATMRTVAYLWRQDRQSKSVKEIAKISGQLYDKFASFIEEMQNVGKRLDSARQHWEKAMNKLSEGKRRGDTLLGKAEKIKELGARTTRSLPIEVDMD